MSLSFYNIKKWLKMLFGKSILHVNQNEGMYYSFNEIKGYYNNLTEKVTKDKKNYNKVSVIETRDERNKPYFFPIAIFQYGLGSYDLMIQNIDFELMRKKFLAQLEWCIDNQQENGSWKTFEHDYPSSPYSAMAQGEGASLLIRGFIETRQQKYLDAAKKAIDFMIMPISNGGTSEYSDDGIILYEVTCKPYIFNGWIFAIFGLLDYVIISNDSNYIGYLSSTMNALISKLEEMDCGYWSYYDCKKTLASSFYHNLHIYQLLVLYKYSNNNKILYYYEKFLNYQSKRKNRRKAFLKKSLQKISEK